MWSSGWRTFASTLAFSFAALSASAIAQSNLRIVVIEGEGAINIIQQKTAVAPVVEVRDRNDQPVAGAVVNFAVRTGRATFNGARTISVTTNAAGRAAAAGLAPSGSGAVQISATAAFQGQSAAAVTIAQTNVMTAAEAAAISSAGGTSGTGSGSAASTGAGGGGGFPLTTVAVIGGAAAAGAVAVDQLGGGTTYRASFSGVLRFAQFGSGSSAVCTQDERQTGEIEITLDKDGETVSGTMAVDGDIALAPGTCQPNQYNTSTDTFGLDGARFTSNAQTLTISANASNDYTNPDGSGVNSYDFTFTGTVDGSQITGVLTIVRIVTFNPRTGGPMGSGRGTVSYSVVLK